MYAKKAFRDRLPFRAMIEKFKILWKDGVDPYELDPGELDKERGDLLRKRASLDSVLLKANRISKNYAEAIVISV